MIHWTFVNETPALSNPCALTETEEYRLIPWNIHKQIRMIVTYPLRFLLPREKSAFDTDLLQHFILTIHPILYSAGAWYLDL